MKCYHGTTEENWKKIKKEGILFGGDTYHKTNGNSGYRYTYLTPEYDIAKNFGEIVLEIEYEPVGVGSGIDNYGFNPPSSETCWQFSVFVPISLDSIIVIK